MNDKAYKQCIDSITKLQQQLEEEEQKLFAIMASRKCSSDNQGLSSTMTIPLRSASSATQIAC